MAGELCQRSDEAGWGCVMAAEHYGPCNFGKAVTSALVRCRQHGTMFPEGGSCWFVDCTAKAPEKGEAMSEEKTRCGCGAEAFKVLATSGCSGTAWEHDACGAVVTSRAEAEEHMRRCGASAPIAGTPATMLGEALVNVQRARMLVQEAQTRMPSGHYLGARADGFLESAEEAVEDMKRHGGVELTHG